MEKGASYLGLEIIAKLAMVPEVELLERIEAELADETRGRPRSGGSESVPPLVHQLLTRRSANLR